MLSKDGTRASLHTQRITKCPLISHRIRDVKMAEANYITEIVEETSKVSAAIPLSSQMFLKVGKSGYICGDTNLNLEDYYEETKNIREGIDIWDKSKRVYTDYNFRTTKAKEIGSCLLKEKTKCTGLHICYSIFILT